MTADAAPYQPHDGEVGHLTIRATYRAAREDVAASYAIEAPTIDRDGPWTWIAAEEWLGHRTSGVVDFRPLPLPPLPTVPGSMILAHVAGIDRPDLLELLEVGAVDSATTGRPAGDLAWESSSNGRVRPEDIFPSWVQIDPATLQPVAVTA